MHANKIDKTKCAWCDNDGGERATAKARERVTTTRGSNEKSKCQMWNKSIAAANSTNIKCVFFFFSRHFSRKPDVQPLVARANFSLFVCSHHFASIIYETLLTLLLSPSCHAYFSFVCENFLPLSLSLSLTFAPSRHFDTSDISSWPELKRVYLCVWVCLVPGLSALFVCTLQIICADVIIPLWFDSI